MFSTPSSARVTAIVPAYNEARRIGRVLDILSTYPGFGEIIVIDDSSDDDTGAVVRRYPAVTYRRGPGHQGKGQAMDMAARQARGDILFFCDADLSGLTHDIIRQILAPVLEGRVAMSVAVRGRGVPWFTTAMARLFPRATLIAGERAVTRRLWEALPDRYKQGFKIEIALNHLASGPAGGGLVWRTFPPLEHVPKEVKLGIWEGLTRRLKEIAELVSITLYLHAVPIEPRQKNGRAASQ